VAGGGAWTLKERAVIAAAEDAEGMTADQVGTTNKETRMKNRVGMRVKQVGLVLLGMSAASGAAAESGVGDFFTQLIKPLRIQIDAHAQNRTDVRDAITPSHVHQATQDLIAEIEILREAMGIFDYPAEAEPQEDRSPIHVYSKSLEVMQKIAWVQRRLGILPVKVGQIPVKNITPKDVFASVEILILEIRRLKAQLVIEDEINPAPFVGGKTPSLVFKSLADASFLLDGLVGRPLSPSDVFTHIMHVHDEMELVAAKLKTTLELDLPIVEGRKRPTEVAQQALRAIFKVINLQTRLGMDASGVPNLTLVRVTPAELYEAANIMLAEMVRVKAHLGITLPREERRDARNKRPRDVFAELLLVIRNLDILAKAAADQAG